MIKTQIIKEKNKSIAVILDYIERFFYHLMEFIFCLHSILGPS